MSTITIEQGVASLMSFLIGGTVSSADAANSAGQAVTEKDPMLQLLDPVSAWADLLGISTSTGQML